MQGISFSWDGIPDYPISEILTGDSEAALRLIHLGPSVKVKVVKSGGVVQSLSHIQLFATYGQQYARLSCPSLSPVVCSNSCPLS